ncbi:MAG: hypothetical protein ACJ71N_02335 [Terriglobales bacterium]
MKESFPVLIVSIAMLSISGCSQPKQRDFVGKYVHRDSNGVEELILRSDNTFEQSFAPAKSQSQVHNSGKWKLSFRSEMLNRTSWSHPKEKLLVWVAASDEIKFENLWLINHPLGEFNPDFQQHRAGLSTYELRSSGNKFYLSEDAENTIHLDKVD